jgi:hypothetical protein
MINAEMGLYPIPIGCWLTLSQETAKVNITKKSK